MVPGIETVLVLILLCAHRICGSYQVPRHVALHSQEDIDTLPWSHKHLQLTRNGNLHILYNHTEIATGSRSASLRYLAREVIPHYKRLTSSFLEPFYAKALLTKRAFVANSVSAQVAQSLPEFKTAQQKRYVTWSWKREANPGCPTYIQLCFANQQTRDTLYYILGAAIAKWHTALGDTSQLSIRFGLVPGDFCRNAQQHWIVDRDAVEIFLGNAIEYSGAGWRSGVLGGRMRLQFQAPSNPRGDLTPEQVTAKSVTQMTHELGHVLGLMHEHQRYDARQYIQYNWDNLDIPIQDLDYILDDYEQVTGEYITSDQVLGDYLTLRRVENRLRQANVQLQGTDQALLNTLKNIVPFAWRPEPYVQLQVDFIMDGAFDFASIMIYDSWIGTTSIHDDEALMVKRSDESTWGEPRLGGIQEISPGDVAAVKRIYPDLPEA